MCVWEKNMNKHQTVNGSELIEQEKNVVVVVVLVSVTDPKNKNNPHTDLSVHITAEVAATPNIYAIL